MVLVTDVKRILKNKEVKTGYYMDGYLAENLQGIPYFLQKDFDCVGIISGRGKVRTGKSTIGSQIGNYCAWLIAGGRMELIRDEKGNFANPRVIKSPDKPVRFSLKNYAFNPEDLMRLGRKLPMNSVIVYDEGRTGLDAKTSMTSLNRLLEDFFQECGQYNHVILIILPDFFKLHMDYAVNRSYFLVDVFLDSNFNRGFFNFYNETQKDFLYNHGKKKLGTLARYTAGYPSFSGRFTGWLPFDKEDYSTLKRLALKKKELGQKRAKIKEQRDALAYMYKADNECTLKEVGERLSVVLKKKIGQDVIKHAVDDYRTYLEKKDEYDKLMIDQSEFDKEEEEN